MTLDTVSDFLHKPLLELIHHNTKSLDGLLDECVATLHSRFHPGEHVVCKEHNSSCGVVLGLSDTDHACLSPSCDKENNLVTCGSSPRLLPLHYRVLLKQSKIELSDVAYSDLSRVECLPSRDALGVFVSRHASREPLSPAHPWVVSSAMMAKHALKNKIAPMFLPLAERKRAQQQQQNSADHSRKRKSSTGKSSSAKKSKLSRSEKSNSGSNSNNSRSAGDDECRVIGCVSPSSQTTLNACARIVSAKKPAWDAASVSKTSAKPADVTASASNHIADDVSVNRDGDGAVVVVSDGGEQKTASAADRGDSDDSDNVTLIKIAKSTSKIDALRQRAEEQRAKKLKKRREWRERQKQLKERLAKGDKKKQRTLSRTEESNSPAADTTSPKMVNGKTHNMRQMSLFDMNKYPRAGGKSLSGSGTGSGAKKRQLVRCSDSERPLPPCVLKLSKLLDSGRRVGPQNYFLLMCLRMLLPDQVERIEHEATRQLLRHRLQRAEERKQLAKLSVEERQEYLKNKRLEIRRQKNMRFDDQSLPDLSALPPAQPVAVLDGLPNSLFGQLAMVAEFVSGHWSMLAPTATDPVQAPHITTRTLMHSLLADADSTPYRQFGELVTMLLRTLLKDDAYESYCELGVPVFSLPITPQTAGELCRMCLRHAARGDADSDSDVDADEFQLDETSEHLVELLETGELYELSPVQRLQLLEWFVQQLLASNSLAVYVEQREERLRNLCAHRNNIVRERRAKAPSSTAAADPEPADPEPQLPDAEHQSDDGQVSASGRVRRSLRNAEEARRDREAKEKEAKERRLQQIEHQRRERQEHQVLEEHADAVRSHASLLRRAPLGLDRNHRRYWLLQAADPFALYVETGWAGPDTVPMTTGKQERDDSEDEDKPLSLMREQKEEATFPPVGQNMWFCYTSLDEVTRLISVLAERGRRESALKEALQAVYDTIKESFSSASPSDSDDTSKAKPNEAETTPLKQEAPADVKDESAGENTIMEVDDADDKSEAEVVGDNKSEVKDVGDESEEKDVGDKSEMKAPRAEEGGKGESGVGELLMSLREDLLGVEQELSAGLLGGVPEHDGRALWQQQVSLADSAQLLAPLLLRCFHCIPARALKEPLAPVSCADDAASTEGASGKCWAQQWCDAVGQCVTLSRLHVLVGVLDSSIRWGLSSAQKKCRTCRRAGLDTGEAAVCPQCTHLYHWRCVRPPLYSTPGADWLCPACTPREQRVSRRGQQQTVRQDKCVSDDDGGENGTAADESDEAELKESVCRVCQSDDPTELIVCPQCPAAFHKQCHEPPVTLRIRAGWECMDCKVQQAPRGRRKGAKTPLPSTVLRQAREAADSGEGKAFSSEEEEHEEHEQEEDDSEEEQSPVRQSRRKSNPSRARRGSKRRAAPAETARRRSGRTAPRDYRAMVSDVSEPEVSQSEESGAEEARIRALSTDEEGDGEEGAGRQACWVISSPARQRQIRAQRRRMRSSPLPLPLQSETDGE